MNTITKQIQALLFWKGEPVAFSFIVKTLSITEEDLQASLAELAQILSDQGIRLINHNREVSLATYPEGHELISALTKDELTKPLSKAAIETLSVIAYRGPVSRSEIDYIRGVNSQFSLRNLLVRGLIERANDSENERRVVYTVSVDFLKHLGLTSLSELPRYTEYQSSLKEFEESKQANETES